LSEKKKTAFIGCFFMPILFASSPRQEDKPMTDWPLDQVFDFNGHQIPNAGHLVQEDAPEAIVAALLRFLPLQKSS